VNGSDGRDQLPDMINGLAVATRHYYGESKLQWVAARDFLLEAKRKRGLSHDELPCVPPVLPEGDSDYPALGSGEYVKNVVRQGREGMVLLRGYLWQAIEMLDAAAHLLDLSLSELPKSIPTAASNPMYADMYVVTPENSDQEALMWAFDVASIVGTSQTTFDHVAISLRQLSVLTMKETDNVGKHGCQ